MPFSQRSYAADYIGFLLLLAGFMLVQMVGEPFHRMFSLDNRGIQYPHAVVERVPVSMQHPIRKYKYIRREGVEI